jgi:hypothetical protein
MLGGAYSGTRSLEHARDLLHQSLGDADDS